MEKQEIKEIMKETCYGSLAYCCKDYCDIRNKVMKKIGLTREDFLKLKRLFDKELFKLLKGGENGKKRRNEV